MLFIVPRIVIRRCTSKLCVSVIRRHFPKPVQGFLWQLSYPENSDSRSYLACVRPYNTRTSLTKHESTSLQRVSTQTGRDAELLLSKLFPKPMVSIHVLSDRVKSRLGVPQIYSCSYRRAQEQHECVLSVTWPEKQTFTGVGKRKSEARARASFQAMVWFYSNNHVNQEAQPIFRDTFQSKNNIQVDLNQYSLTSIDTVLRLHSETILPILSTPVEEEPFPEGDQSTKNSHHPILGIPFPSSDDLNIYSKKLQSDKGWLSDKILFPIDSYRNQILELLKTNRVTIVKGETGCGKTTRVPQYILDEAIREGQGALCNIVVVQPRRLTAMQTAKFVASELGEQIGGSVGYSVKMSSKLPSVIGGSITFMTGMKLAMKFSKGPLLGVSHIVLDEVHMRDLGTDLVMTLLKQAMAINKELKVVIMSATVNISMFQSYFECFGKVPSLTIPGRTFPVKMQFLEDLPSEVVQCARMNDDEVVEIDFLLVERVISWIHKTKPAGAILTFLSGLNDISNLQKSLSKQENLLIVPVHSMYRDCAAAFEPAPRNLRKVILATNIAETSITFPDVVYVVDCGIHKKPHRNMLSPGGWSVSGMSLEWISKASLLQRRGRAGRVQPGESFHLLTKDVFNSMRDYELPAVETESLEFLVLSIKLVNPDIKAEDLLKEFPTPPRKRDVRETVKTLQTALLLNSNDETPTPLASVVMNISSTLPSALALIYSVVFRCFDQTLSIVAAEETPLVFFKTAAEERAIKAQFHSTSDHLAKGKLINAHNLSSPFVSHPSYKQTQALKTFLKMQILSTVNIKNAKLDESESEEIVKSVLLKSFSSVLVRAHSKSYHSYLRHKSGVRSYIKSRSVNQKYERLKSPFFMYIKGNVSENLLHVSDTSVVSPLSMLLFLPSDLKEISSSDADTKVFKVCGMANVTLTIPARDYDRIIGLQKAMQDVVNYFVKAEFLNQPDKNIYLWTKFRENLILSLKEVLNTK